MKKWWPFAFVFFVLFAGFRLWITSAQPGSQVNDIGSKARGVFTIKCAGCHGADLAKPKGRFGYVLDLKRIAANPEFVIPLSPDESEMWVLIDRDEMPPAESPQGPLTPEQKEIIKVWISAGAPDNSSVRSFSGR